MITVISTGRNHGVDQPWDIHVPAYNWPAPPPILRTLDGRHDQVAAAVLHPNPVVLDELKITADFARTLAEHQDEVTVVVECNDGIHRAVAGAEFIAGYARQHGTETRVFHRDLGRRSA